MHAGLELLRSDSRVRRAFQLANHAMLLQQLRSRRRSARETRYNGDTQRIEVIEPLEVPDWREVSDRGDWRPFQIAFVLTALGSTASLDSPERDTVELIFFPTGGGKTEAYLCLAAFSMFYRRLADPERHRCRCADAIHAAAAHRAAVPARGRAHLRHGAPPQGGGRSRRQPVHHRDLGRRRRHPERSRPKRERSSGSSIAATATRRTSSSSSAARGAPRRWARSRARARGSATRHASPDMRNATGQSCSAARIRTCEFAGGLPIHVIDEDIYNDPPTLVIGTIDKFAMLAWRPEARALFGIGLRRLAVRLTTQPRHPGRAAPHLRTARLSGRSVRAAHRRALHGPPGRPQPPAKIVTSTATIRRSEQQIRRPLRPEETPSSSRRRGLDADDSFFARYARDADGTLRPGRLYVGVHGPGLGSLQTAQVRTFAALLQAPAGLRPRGAGPVVDARRFLQQPAGARYVALAPAVGHPRLPEGLAEPPRAAPGRRSPALEHPGADRPPSQRRDPEGDGGA